MFRQVARKKNEITQEECLSLLKECKRGILSVIGDNGYPYGVPLNHYYCEQDGKLYFHSGKKGHKVDAFLKEPKASFCVYEDGVKEPNDWALTVRSVVVFGKIELITEQETIYDISRKLSLKFTDDLEYIEQEIEKFGPATLMFALVPEHITGKRVREA